MGTFDINAHVKSKSEAQVTCEIIIYTLQLQGINSGQVMRGITQWQKYLYDDHVIFIDCLAIIVGIFY